MIVATTTSATMSTMPAITISTATMSPGMATFAFMIRSVSGHVITSQLIVWNLRDHCVKVICHDQESNTFHVELEMQLGYGSHKTRMLDLGKKFINLGTLSKRLPFFKKIVNIFWSESRNLLKGGACLLL